MHVMETWVEVGEGSQQQVLVLAFVPISQKGQRKVELSSFVPLK